MKNLRNAVILAVTAMAASASASAGVADMAGSWSGLGASFALNGTPGGEYFVELDETLQADGSVQGNVTVLIPGSPNLQFTQIMRDSDHGFSIKSDQGSGGAVCLGEGLCEGYVGDENGNGVAMTLVKDGPSNLRMLKTQLQGFKAVGFYREIYVRTQSQ